MRMLPSREQQVDRTGQVAPECHKDLLNITPPHYMARKMKDRLRRISLKKPLHRSASGQVQYPAIDAIGK